MKKDINFGDIWNVKSKQYRHVVVVGNGNNPSLINAIPYNNGNFNLEHIITLSNDDLISRVKESTKDYQKYIREMKILIKN